MDATASRGSEGSRWSLPVEIPTATVAAMYQTALTIRLFEQRAIEQYRVGNIRGYLHPYTGEEGIAVGACAALRPTDYIVSTHRGHGHAIAKGHEPRLMMAELLGRETGYCRGRGGSMHVSSLALRNLAFGRGIHGAQFLIAALRFDGRNVLGVLQVEQRTRQQVIDLLAFKAHLILTELNPSAGCRPNHAINILLFKPVHNEWGVRGRYQLHVRKARSKPRDQCSLPQGVHVGVDLVHQDDEVPLSRILVVGIYLIKPLKKHADAGQQ